MNAMASAATLMASKSKAVPSLRLQCPLCGTVLGALSEQEPSPAFDCKSCHFELRAEDGIWRALAPDRVAHFARFMKEYESIREAEGRGSSDADYYLALPYRDLSGHNQAQWAIRGQTYRFLEQTIFPTLESGGLKNLGVLDLGAGNCWMSYRLALRGYSPVAVDLLASQADGLGAAIHYRGQIPELFPRFQAELDRLPFASGQFDVAIFNASFHYSENYGDTLGEAIRCLRPGGTVIIADTAWYSRNVSGERMVAERREQFTKRYGFPSDAIASLEYLTDQRLNDLERQFGITWRVYAPFYGVQWALRPVLAKLKGKREPSRFRIYAAEVSK